MRNNKGFHVSFAWLFAIIVGIVIIFLAIYLSVKYLGTGQEATSAQLGEEIEILANTLEIGFEAAKTTYFEMPVETRIKNNCDKFGVFGNQGRGLVHQANLSGEIFAQVVTFGKALGAFGAIVLGNQLLKETLVNFAKSFIYTTALPFPSLAAIKCSYVLFPELETERTHLRDLIQLANCSHTPIHPFPVASNQAAHALVSTITKEGFDIRALLSPTVQRGKERLRLTLHAFNSREELIHLLQRVRKYG